MASLHSSSVFQAILAAMQGIEILSGSKTAPTVERFDGEKGSTKTPGIRITRTQEEHRKIGEGPFVHRLIPIRVTVLMSLWSYRDPESSETVEEVIEEDMGDVLKALYGIDWEGLKANPLPIAWTPIHSEVEDEVEIGAMIRFSVEYHSFREDLGLVMDPAE